MVGIGGALVGRGELYAGGLRHDGRLVGPLLGEGQVVSGELSASAQAPPKFAQLVDPLIDQSAPAGRPTCSVLLHDVHATLKSRAGSLPNCHEQALHDPQGSSELHR